MRVGHLNLAVADVERSREFYEEFFGFDFGPNEFHDGVLFLRDRHRFELALRPVDGAVAPGDLHFGFQLVNAEAVDELRWKFEHHGVAIVEWVEQEGFSLVRVKDPDGYEVEAYWDAELPPERRMTTWDPLQYLRFEGPRLRPALDLIARLDHPSPSLVVDLGCGTGPITALLADRWPDAEVVGVDSSPSMLEGARRDHPDLTWVEADLARWAPDRPVDVLFSNAALHWVPDHAALFPALFAHVAPGGMLAVQVPGMWEAPSHTIAFDLVHTDEWRDRLDGAMRERPLLTPEGYLDVLEPLAEVVDVWTTTYFDVLDGPHPVVEWFKGSLLRAFLSRLDEADGQRFVDQYTERVDAAYPPRPDGRTILPFRRLFVTARRSV